MPLLGNHIKHGFKNVIFYDLVKHAIHLKLVERLFLTFTPTNYVKIEARFFFEFLIFAYIEIPQLSNFPEGATVAPSHGYVWENYKLQDVISYDTYYAILLKFGEVTLDIVTYILKQNSGC